MIKVKLSGILKCQEAATLYGGKMFRTFNVIDDFNREYLTIEIDTSITGKRLITYREEVLSLYVFRSLSEVRETTYWWRNDYNDIRPHNFYGGPDTVGLHALLHQKL